MRGAAQSAIYDLLRWRMIMFATPYIDLLEELLGCTLAGIESRYSTRADWMKIRGFIDYLLREDIAAYLPADHAFPPLAREWAEPSLVHNAIIDFDDGLHDLESIMLQLDRMGCRFLQVRCFSTLLDWRLLGSIASIASRTGLQGIEAMMRFDPEGDEKLACLARDNPLISRVTLFGAPSRRSRGLFAESGLSGGYGQKWIEYVVGIPGSCEACGCISRAQIQAPSVNLFVEAQHFNGCLNRKVSIDSKGEIRNCPSMPRGYGHVSSTRLDDVVKSTEFRRPWLVRKDQIEVCRDCQFRYACTDCRAYTQGGAEFGKPSKCGYDPYRDVWESPSTS